MVSKERLEKYRKYIDAFGEVKFFLDWDVKAMDFIDALDDMEAKANGLEVTITEQAAENQRLKAVEGYLRRHFIATCPDDMCDEDCKKCPSVDGWIKRISDE